MSMDSVLTFRVSSPRGGLTSRYQTIGKGFFKITRNCAYFLFCEEVWSVVLLVMSQPCRSRSSELFPKQGSRYTTACGEAGSVRLSNILNIFLKIPREPA